MARRNSGPADKGSQFHLQKMVNFSQEYLNHLILSNSPSLKEYTVKQPVWVSPLDYQNYREYRDGAFLKALGLSDLKQQLVGFWPRFGPYWDALATAAGNNHEQGVILLEAKSHFNELGKPDSACGAKGKGLKKIESSLSIVKSALGVNIDCSWLGKYYQYANRIAHLYWLNVAEQIPTWMVLLYFIGDHEQHGPNTVVEWKTKLTEMKTEMGLPEFHLLTNRIIEIFSPIQSSS